MTTDSTTTTSIPETTTVASPAAPVAKKTRAAKPAKKAKAKKADKRQPGDDTRGNSVVPIGYKRKYAKNHDSCGDGVADALRETTTTEDGTADVGALASVARKNGLDIKKWAHLKNRDGSTNVGMIRMNLGNCLRGLVRNGTTVTIGSHRFEAKKEAKTA